MSHNGMASIKFTGSQARTIFQYKYTRTKVLKCCANIYFNKQCLINTLSWPEDGCMSSRNMSPRTK